MHIEIAEHERMSESGSSLLRLMQNNDTARLDLLVRESLQNCLDAGDKDSGYESVKVDFVTGKFDTEELSCNFDKIDHSLNEKYPGKRDYIAIRDTNTTGLTGPIRYEDVENNKFGNFLKLVYEISKPQDQSGSGGSWGLGKTVYFRVGIGLVIYYSRVKKTDDNYESRLAAALVEDETKTDTLLPVGTGPQRGIAWWGALDLGNKKCSEKFGRTKTIPVTDEEFIVNILKIFNIEVFSEKETGTIIIIPFIDKAKLLDETLPLETDTGLRTPFWCRSSLEDYLLIAFQRWYAPRIDNRKYDGMFLEVTLNGEKLTTDKMAPIFQLIQSLYNSRPGEEQRFAGKKVNSKPVEIRRNTFSRGDARSGWINYAKVTAEELGMEAPDNLPSPYSYINKSNSDVLYNDPIVLYTRKPGMVVAYSTTDDWTDSIPKSDIGEYIVGIFVANSNNILAQNNISFEEYIRAGEKADHMSWDDWAIVGRNLQIITRVKRGVRKKIKDDFSNMKGISEEKKNLGLGKILADFLLPPVDFTYWDDATGGNCGLGGTGGDGCKDVGSGAGGINSTSHVQLKRMGNIRFTACGIELPVRILFGRKRVARIELEVNSEQGTISDSDWEKNIGKAFPVVFNSFTVTRMTKGKGNKLQTLIGNNMYFDKGQKTKYIYVEFENSKTFDIRTRMRLEVFETDNLVVDGVICYSLDDVQGNIVLKEEN